MFNIVNSGKSNAYATVRLTREQFEAVREFMHSKSDEVRFPRGVTLVHQGRGHYRFWSDLNDENPTPVLELAIRITTKALYEFRNHQIALHLRRPIAYAGGTYVEAPAIERRRESRPTHRPVSRTALEPALSRLASKFRIKGELRV